MTIRGEIFMNEYLSPHTSWHIGGTADRYFAPRDSQDLLNFIKDLSPNEPCTWLGLGSNVLIADEGIRGTLIHTLKMKSQIECLSNNVIRVEASIPCAKVAKFCAKNALKGGAFFAGIPGTIGGALFMNAGAFGCDTWSHVSKVEVMDRTGKIHLRDPEEYMIGYRSVKRKEGANKNQTQTAGTEEKKQKDEEWFVAAHFYFESGDTLEATQEIKALLKKRNNTQPIGVFSCGSVFKNPPGAYVGQLIEQCGLKGFQMGGAHISPKHANFIINTGNAKATDVLGIMKHIVETVYDNYQICLESEVRLLGFPDPHFWYPERCREIVQN